MKKFLIIAFSIFIFQPLSAQPQNKILDEISKEFSTHLTKTIFEKRKKIYRKAGEKNFTNILVENIYNSNGQITQLSEKMSPKIAFDIQDDLNNTDFQNTNYKITSPYDYIKTKQKIDSIDNYDYSLIGQYYFDEDDIVFTKFKLCHIKTDFEITFPDFVYLLDTPEFVKKFDTLPKKADYYQKFIELFKDNIFIKEAVLTKENIKVNSNHIERIGQVYKVDYDVAYNIKLNLKEPAYIYSFFYDPIDQKHDFIWYIDNNNIKFQAEKYHNFWNAPIAFSNSGNSAQYCYLKIIATSKKINIKNFYTKKYINGYKSVIIDRDNSKKLIDKLNNLDNVQTINLVITFN